MGIPVGRNSLLIYEFANNPPAQTGTGGGRGATTSDVYITPHMRGALTSATGEGAGGWHNPRVDAEALSTGTEALSTTGAATIDPRGTGRGLATALRGSVGLPAVGVGQVSAPKAEKSGQSLEVLDTIKSIEEALGVTTYKSGSTIYPRRKMEKIERLVSKFLQADADKEIDPDPDSMSRVFRCLTNAVNFCSDYLLKPGPSGTRDIFSPRRPEAINGAIKCIDQLNALAREVERKLKVPEEDIVALLSTDGLMLESWKAEVKYRVDSLREGISNCAGIENHGDLGFIARKISWDATGLINSFRNFHYEMEVQDLYLDLVSLQSSFKNIVEKTMEGNMTDFQVINLETANENLLEAVESYDPK